MTYIWVGELYQHRFNMMACRLFYTDVSPEQMYTYFQFHYFVLASVRQTFVLFYMFTLYFISGWNSSCWFDSEDSGALLTIQYSQRNMHTVFALLCFVVVIHWLIFPYPSGLLHWHCGNLTIASVPAKQPWWIWINTSCEFIMNDCITTTKQSTTKPCAYFLGYTVKCAVLPWYSFQRLSKYHVVSDILIHWRRDTFAAISQTTFSRIFRLWKYLNFA